MSNVNMIWLEDELPIRLFNIKNEANQVIVYAEFRLEATENTGFIVFDTKKPSQLLGKAKNQLPIIKKTLSRKLEDWN